MSERMRAAVITTRERPDDFGDCFEAIRPQVDYLIVVAHMHPPYLADTHGYYRLLADAVLWYDEEPMNISRAWNLGLAAAATLVTSKPYDVAVLNDDAVVPANWFAAIRHAMDETGAVAGSGECYEPFLGPGERHYNCTPGPHDLQKRLAGHAFILDGTAGLSIDEQFQWWAGDADVEYVARSRGGTVIVGGVKPEHRHPNATTVGVLAEIAQQDLERFQTKWSEVGGHG